LEPAIEGMLGFFPDALSNHLVLSPCFPWNWEKVTINNMRIGKMLVNMRVHQTAHEYNYDFENTGSSSLSLNFNPVLPPGTQVYKVLANGKEIRFTPEQEQEAVKVILSRVSVKQHLKISIRYTGGIGVLPLVNELQPGARNDGAKITAQQWQKNKYMIQVEGIPGKMYELNVFSLKPIHLIQNAVIKNRNANIYTITTTLPEDKSKYVKHKITIDF
jgi:hypothetical protein